MAMSTSKSGKKVLLLDTIPFLFLFSKLIQSLGKTIGEILLDYNYCFFVVDDCWKKVHFLKWKHLGDITDDFGDTNYLNYLQRKLLRDELRKLDVELYDKINELYYGKEKTKFFGTVDEVRLTYFQKDIPNKEETEVITMGMLIEQNEEKKYFCRTMAILADDKHTIMLAKLYSEGVRVSNWAQLLTYPIEKKKTLTLIDFLRSEASNLFSEDTIYAFLSNYCKLKLSKIRKDPLKEIVERLPILSLRKLGPMRGMSLFLRRFKEDKISFCTRIMKLMERYLHESSYNYFRSQYMADDKIFTRLQQDAYKRLNTKYRLLVEGFYNKYSSYLKPNDKKNSIKMLEEFKAEIEKKRISICKNITLRNI